MRKCIAAIVVVVSGLSLTMQSATAADATTKSTLVVGDGTTCRSQTGTASKSTTSTDATSTKTTTESQTLPVVVCSQSGDALLGFHWGAGFVYSSDLDGIGSVAVVKGPKGNPVISVSQENKDAVRAGFELHYFIPLRYYNDTTKSAKWANWIDGTPIGESDRPELSIGPFISLDSKGLSELQGSNPFPAAGVGIMVGGRPFVGADDGKSSVQLGAGWMIDTSVKELGAGLTDGQETSLAVGADTSSLLRTVTKQGFMMMFSYNFTIN